MQDHSTIIQQSPLNFSHKEAHVRRNLAFVNELNEKMKNDINAARRKLTNSVTTNNVREINFRNNARLVNREEENNRTLRTDKSDPHIVPQPVNMLYNNINAPVPEENDYLIQQLRGELSETRRQLEYLRQNHQKADSDTLLKANETIVHLQQIIAQNDFHAKQAISTLQQEKEQLRIKFEQLTITMETLRNKNQRTSSQSELPLKPCERCQRLQERIRELQAELRSVNSKYEAEKVKFSQLQQQKIVSDKDVNNRIKTLGEKLAANQVELQQMTADKIKLQRKIVEINSQQVTISDEKDTIRQKYQFLNQQYEKIYSQFQQLSTQHSQSINQLTFFSRKLYDLHYEVDPYYKQGEQYDISEAFTELEAKISEYKLKLSEKFSQSQELQIEVGEKGRNLQKLSEQYSELLQRLQRHEDLEAHYKQQIEQLQRQLSLRIKKDQSTVQQFQQSLLHELQQQKNKNSLLQTQLHDYQFQLKETKSHLAQTEHYINRIANHKIQEQNTTITRLNSQLQALQEQTSSQGQTQLQINSLTIENKQLKNTIQRLAHQQPTTSQSTQQFALLENSLQQSQWEVEKLKKELFTATSQNQHADILREQVESLESMLQRVNNDNQILRNQLLSLSTQHRACSQHTSSLDSTLQQVNREKAKLVQQKQDIQSTLRVKQQQLLSLEQRLKSQQQMMDAQETNQLKTLLKQNQHKLQTTISTLTQQYEQKISTLTNQLKQHHEVQLYQIRKMISTELQITIEQQQHIIGELQSKLNSRQQEQQKYEFTIAQLNAEQESLKKQTTSQTQMTFQLNNLETQNAHLKQQITALASQLQNCNSSRSLADLQTLLETANLQNRRLQIQNEQWRQRVQNLEQSSEQALLILQKKLQTIEQSQNSSQSNELLRLLQETKLKQQQEIETLIQQQQEAIRNSQYQAKILYEQQLVQAREELIREIQRAEETQTLTITKLQAQIKQLKNEKGKASSEKLGELVIKHNTLNIDFKNLQNKLKEKEDQLLKEQQNKLTLEQQNTIAVTTITALTQDKQKLIQENQIHYNHLEQAEAYIAQLQQKIGELESQPAPATTVELNIENNPEFLRLKNKLINSELEKQQLQDKYENLLSIQQEETRNVFQQLEATQNNFQQESTKALQLNKKVVAAEQQHKKAQQLAASLQQQLQPLREQVNQLTQQASQHTIQRNQLIDQANQLTQQLANSTNETNKYKQLYETTLNNLRLIESEKQQMNLSIQELQAEITKRSEDIKKVTHSEEHIQHQEISTLIGKVKTLESENIKSTQEINHLRQEISLRVEEIRKLSDSTTLEHKPLDHSKRSQQEIAMLLSQLKQLEGEKAEYSLEITRLQSEITRSSLEIERLTFEVNRLSTTQFSPRQSQEAQGDEALLEKIRKQAREREDRLNEIQLQNKKIKGLNSEIEGELKNRMHELLHAQKTIEEMKNKVHLDSASRRSDTNEYKDAYSRIQHQLSESRKLLNGASDHILRLQEAITRAEDQIRGLNTYIYELEKKSEPSSPVQAFEETNEELLKEKITSLEADNESLKSKITELEQHIGHLQGKQDKPTLSQAEFTTLMQQNESRLTHINTLTEKLLQLEKENLHNNTQASQLEKALTAQTQTRDEKISQLQEELAKTSRNEQFFKGKLKQAEEYIFLLQEGAKDTEERPAQGDEPEKQTDFNDNQKLTKTIESLQTENGAFIKLLAESEQTKQKISLELEFFIQKLKEAEEHIFLLENQPRTATEADTQQTSILTKEIEVLKEQLQAKLTIISQQTKQLQELAQDRENIQHKFTESEQKYSAALQQLQNQLKQTEQTIRKAEVDKVHAQQLNKATIQQLEQDLQNSKEQQEKANQLAHQAQQAKEKAQKTANDLKASLLNIQQELESTIIQHKHSQQVIIQLEANNKQIKEEITRSQGTVNSQKNQTHELEQLQKDNDKLKEETIKLQLQKNQLQSAFSAQSEELKALAVKNASQHQQLRTLSEKTTQLELALVESTTKVNFLESSKTKADQKLQQARGQLEKNQQNIEFFKGKLQEAQTYIFYLEENNPQSAPSRGKVDLQNTIDHLEAIIKDLTEQQALTARTLEQTKFDHSKIQALLATKEEQLKNSEEQVFKLQEEKKTFTQKITHSQLVISSHTETIEHLQAKLHSTEQEFSKTRRQLEETIRSLTQQIELLQEQLKTKTRGQYSPHTPVKQQPGSKDKKRDTPDSGIDDKSPQFFKNKLLEAESYIQVMEQEKHQMELTYESLASKLHHKEEEMKKLSRQLTLIEQEKHELNQNIKELELSNDQLKENLRTVAVNSSNEELLRLNYLVNQLRKDLTQQEESYKEQHDSLSRRAEEAETYLASEKQRAETAQNNVKELHEEIKEIEIQKEHFKSKAQQSQLIIASLKGSDQSVLKSISSKTQLEQKYHQITDQNKKLQIQLKSTHSRIQQLQNNQKYFQGKLLEAETYILELQKDLKKKDSQGSEDRNIHILRDKIIELQQKNRELEMKLILSEEKEKNYIENINTLEHRLHHAKESLDVAEKEIDSATSQNRQKEQLLKDLEEQVSKISKNNEKEPEFFKKKLLEAEAYISDLIKENSTLKTQEENQPDKIAQMASQIAKLEKELSETSNAQQSTSLRQKIIELQQRNKEIEEQYASTKISEEQLTATITELKKKLATAEQQADILQKKVTLNISSNEEAAMKITLFLQREQTYLQKINSLETNLMAAQDVLAQLRKQIEQKSEKKEQEGEGEEDEGEGEALEDEGSKDINFFKNKLSEAEAYIAELIDENTSLKAQISAQYLNQDIINLKQTVTLKEETVTKLGQLLEEAENKASHFKEKYEQAQALLEIKPATNSSEEKLQQEVASLQAKNKDLQNQNNFLNTTVQELSNINIDLKDKMLEHSQQATKVEQQLMKIKTEAQQTQKKCETLFLASQSQEQIIKNYQQKIKTISEQRESQTKSLQDKLFETEAHLADALTANNALKTQWQANRQQMRSEIGLLKQTKLLQEEKISKLTTKNSELSSKIRELEELSSERTSELESFSSDAKQFEQMLQGKQAKFMQHIRILNEELSEKNRIIEQLEKEKEEAEDHAQEAEQKVEELLEESPSRKSSESEAESTTFFKEKLFQAEAYAKQLQQEKDAMQRDIQQLNGKLSKLGQQIDGLKSSQQRPQQDSKLVQLLVQANKTITELKQENTKLHQKRSIIRAQIPKSEEKDSPSQPLMDEAAFFKKKLYEAESYIAELQDKDTPPLESAAFFRDKLYQAEAYIVDLQNKLKPASSENNQPSAFLKNKLFQAESYIVQLQKQAKVLSEQSQENQLRANQLASNLSQLKNKLDLEIIQLTTQNTNIKEELTKTIKEKENLAMQIETLKIDLDKERTASKNIIEVNAQIIRLQEKLRNKDESIKDLNDQLTQKSTSLTPSRTQFFEQKLLEAESFAAELQKQNESLNNNCEQLKERIDLQDAELTDLKQQIDNKDTQLLVLTTQNNSLKEQIQTLARNIEQTEKRKQSTEEVEQLRENIKALQKQLNEEQLKSQIEFDMLSNNLTEKEDKLNQALSFLSALQEKTGKLTEDKQQQLDLLAKMERELLQANHEIQTLQSQNVLHHNRTEDLLAQIKHISEENNKLHEQIDKNSNRSVDGDKEEEQQILPPIKQEQHKAENTQELKEELKSLLGQVSSLKIELEQRNNSLASQGQTIQSLQTQLAKLQTDHQSLIEKVIYLQDVQRQFQEFKNVLKQKEQAQKELQQIEKEIEDSSDKINQSRGSSEAKEGSSIKNKKLEESLEEANKQLENEMKEEPRHETKQLEKEISNLKRLLEETEKENTILSAEKTNQMKVIKEVGETNQQLEQQVILLNKQVQTSKDLAQQVINDHQQLQMELEQLKNQPNNQLDVNIALLAQQIVQRDALIHQLQNKLEIQQKESAELEKQTMNSSIAQAEHRASVDLQQYESLKNILQEERAHLVMVEKQLDSLKIKLSHSSEELRKKSERLEELQLENLKREEEHLKREEMLEEDLNEAEKRLSSQSIDSENKEKLSSSIRKLISITNNIQEETADPTEVLQELEEFPYLNELITSILYRLRLSSAIQLEKGLKIQEQKQQLEQQQLRNYELQQQINRFKASINILKEENELLRNTNQKLQTELLKKFEEKRASNSQLTGQVEPGKEPQDGEQSNDQRYNELLNEVVQYQLHNNQLTEQLEFITEAHQKLKEEIEDYKEQIKALTSSANRKDLSQENFQLRKKLEQSEKLRAKENVDNSLSMGTQSLLRLEFLNVCLERIDELQGEIKLLQNDIERVASKEKRLTISSNDAKMLGEDSQLLERLQDLEDRLLRNASNIREHQQKSDGQLYSLLKELLDDEQISEVSKKKIEDYLTQLEHQILRQQEEHQAEITILREQIARKERQTEQGLSDRSREDLLRQINNLNNAIQIYHQQSMRRKRVYKQTLDALLKDIEMLNQRLQDEELAQVSKQIQEALEREEEEDLQFNDEDIIITGGNGQMKVIDMKERDSDRMKEFGEGISEERAEPVAIQTEADNKPFLKYLLSLQDLDKEDMKLLKRKIAELKGREVQQNLAFLKGQEKKLEEVMLLANKETSPQQIENIMVTLANNYSRDEISQIFGSEDADQLINKLNQALCLEESFYKGQNASFMQQQIQERKKKYYETSTKLSEQVCKYLLLMLAAKKDHDFFEQVESLFRSMYEIEENFQNSLKKKDDMYRAHNERMNQIFNRSSSDNSQDYLAEFQRSNQQEIKMQSQRKGKYSEGNSEAEQEANNSQ